MLDNRQQIAAVPSMWRTKTSENNAKASAFARQPANLGMMQLCGEQLTEFSHEYDFDVPQLSD